MIVAVTGPRKLPAGKGEEWTLNLVRPLLREAALEMREFRNGVQQGVDILTLKEMMSMTTAEFRRSGLRRIGLYIPKGLSYAEGSVRTIVRTYHWQRNIEQIKIGGGYIKRSHAMLKGMSEEDVLLAYPSSGKEVLRSGTWATVRQARKQKVRIWVQPLDASPGWRE